MARLTIQQTQAPNFSASGQMLANAGKAFNEGLTAAGDLLGTYQEGREAVGDQALAAELASHKSAADFDAFVAKGGLNNLNISETARADLLGNRGRIADVAGTQADTRLTGQQTTNAYDVNSFRNSENADMVAARTENRGLAAGSVLADAEGRLYGNGRGTGMLEEFEGLRTTSYNDPKTDQDGNQVGQNIWRSGFGSNTYTTEDGKVHQVTQGYGGTAEDAHRDLARRNETEYNPAIIEAVGEEAFNSFSGPQLEVAQSLLHNYGAAAFKGTLRGVADAIRTGDAGAVSSAINSLKGQNGGVNDRRRGIEADTYSSGAGVGTARSSYRDQLAATKYQTPAQLSALSGDVRTATNAGQTRLDAENAARVQDQIDTSLLAAAQNPDIINTPGMVGNAVAIPGLTAGQQLGAIERAQTLGDGSLSSIIAPSTIADPMSAARIDGLRATNEQQLAANDQTRLVEGAQGMESNPTAGLIGATGINSDGEGSYSDQQVSSMINEIAKNNNITPGQAAMAMSENLVVNPGRGEDGGWMPGDFTRNTLERRFPLDRVEKFIKDNFSVEAQATYRGEEQRLRVAGADLSAQELRLSNLRTQAAKYPTGEVPEGITAQMNQIRDQLAENKSPRELQNDLQTYLQQSGTMSRLTGVEPGSDEFKRVMKQIETNMMADPSLGENEKRLLIGALRG